MKRTRKQRVVVLVADSFSWREAVITIFGCNRAFRRVMNALKESKSGEQTSNLADGGRRAYKQHGEDAGVGGV